MDKLGFPSEFLVCKERLQGIFLFPGRIFIPDNNIWRGGFEIEESSHTGRMYTEYHLLSDIQDNNTGIAY